MADIGRSTAELLKDSTPAHVVQYFAAFSVAMGGLSFGTGLGFTSPANPLYNATGTLDETELNLFTSIVNLGALVGGPLAGLLINVLGRKGSMMGSVVLSLAAWALIAFGEDFAPLLSGRIIAGVFTGMTCLVVPTYIGEVSSADIRGALGSSFQLMVTIGILYAYVFGSFIDNTRTLALICAIPTVVYAVLLFFIRESPTFHIAKGKDDEARETLQKLRGKNYDVEPEFRTLRDTQEILNRSTVTMKDLLQPHILKPVLISLATMFFQQTSGINAVLFNLGSIFESANTGMDFNDSAIVVGIVQVIATAVAVPLMDRAGRKILLTTSAAVMALSLVALGLAFYVDGLSWLPLTSLIVYIAAFSVGYGPIPWVLMGEMFSLEVRAAASGLAILTNWGTAFIVTLIFDPLQDAIHEYGTYWMFAGICVVNTIFCVMVVPETKGKTLQEIAAHFGGPELKDDTKPPVGGEKAEASV